MGEGRLCFGGAGNSESGYTLKCSFCFVGFVIECGIVCCVCIVEDKRTACNLHIRGEQIEGSGGRNNSGGSTCDGGWSCWVHVTPHRMHTVNTGLSIYQGIVGSDCIGTGKTLNFSFC